MSQWFKLKLLIAQLFLLAANKQNIKVQVAIVQIEIINRYYTVRSHKAFKNPWNGSIFF